jgi:hypothetical protein
MNTDWGRPNSTWPARREGSGIAGNLGCSQLKRKLLHSFTYRWRELTRRIKSRQM